MFRNNEAKKTQRTPNEDAVVLFGCSCQCRPEIPPPSNRTPSSTTIQSSCRNTWMSLSRPPQLPSLARCCLPVLVDAWLQNLPIFGSRFVHRRT